MDNTKYWRKSAVKRQVSDRQLLKAMHIWLSCVLNTYIYIVLTNLLTKPYIFANSVGLDETARNELSHLNLHCLPFFFYFWTISPFATMNTSKFRDRRFCFRNIGMKEVKELKLMLFREQNKPNIFLSRFKYIQDFGLLPEQRSQL